MCASILPPILPRSLPQWVLPRVPPALPAHSHTPQPALTRHQPRDSLTPEPPSPLLEFSQLPFLFHTLALPLLPSTLTCRFRNVDHSRQKTKAHVVRYEVREVWVQPKTEGWEPRASWRSGRSYGHQYTQPRSASAIPCPSYVRL